MPDFHPSIDQLAPAAADNTALRPATNRPGLVPPLTGNVSDVMRGDGTWGAPPGGAGGPHTHPISEVTNLQAALDGKAAANDSRFTDARTPTAHTHPAGDITGNFASLATAGAVTSSGTGGVGYSTGAGGAVVQSTSKATGVTLNKTTGRITLNAAALAAGAEVSFVVTNSTVAATDVPVVAIQSVGTVGSYAAVVSAVGAGSFSITLSNLSAGSLSQALVLNFAVIKGATS